MKAMMDNLVDRMASARDSVAHFLSGWRRTRQTRRDIEALGSEEAARVYAEIGLTQREFERAMALPFASEDLLLRAMDRLDIDPDEFCVRNPGWFQDMERTCMRCSGRNACRRMMSRAEFAGWHQQFCPNAEDFAQIASPALDRG